LNVITEIEEGHSSRSGMTSYAIARSSNQWPQTNVEALGQQFLAIGLNSPGLDASAPAHSLGLAPVDSHLSSSADTTSTPLDLSISEESSTSASLPLLSVAGACFVELETFFHLRKDKYARWHCSGDVLRLALEQYNHVHQEVASLELQPYWDKSKRILLSELAKEVKQINGRLVALLAHRDSVLYNTG
jgi:hypothetical protein